MAKYKKCTLKKYVWSIYCWNKISYYPLRFMYYKFKNGKYSMFTRNGVLLCNIDKEEFNKYFVKGWDHNVIPN